MIKIDHTNQIINLIRNETNEVNLFYSCGKDSIVLIDMLAKKFDRVICYFMYFVKDLDHIEIYLKWAKNKYKNVEIRQMPHFMLSSIKRSGIYCEPQDVKVQKIGDIEKLIRQETGLKYIFSGMKGVDGFMKRMVLKKYELNAISPVGTVYPLALWTNKEVLRYIDALGLIKPIKYSNKVSNGITFDTDVYLFLQKYYPNDLKKILYEFPLSQMLLINHEQKQRSLQ